MNRRIIGIFITSVLSALPALGAITLDNLPESPISKFCNGGGDLDCSKVTINGEETTKYSGVLGCTNGPKSGISQQELDAAATEYCNLLYNNNSKSSFNFAAANRATQNEIPAWQLPPETNDAVVSTVTEAEEVATVESTVTDTCGPDDKCSNTALIDFLKTNQNKISGAVCINNVVHVTGCVEPYKPQNPATCIRNGETVVYYTECKEQKVGDNCTSKNAKTAKYVKVGNDVVCHAQSCKCGYKLSNHKCIELEKDEKKCTALNASAAYYECQGDKKVCKIETCKDTHFLDSTQNKCVSKKSVKCQDSQTVDATGKCIDQTTIQPTDTNTCGEIDACNKQNQTEFEKQNPNANSTNCINGEVKITGCKDGYNPTGKHTCTRNGREITYYSSCETTSDTPDDPARARAEETCNKIKRGDFLGKTNGATDAECINNQWQITECENSLFGQNEQTATLKGQSIKYYASCEKCSVTKKWKKENHAQDAECDPKTGEIYITECDTGYLHTEQILDSNNNTLGYKKCEPNFETSKNLCEKDDNGKWQEKRNKCDCKNNYFWDENDGCVASTENLNQATKKLEQLKSLLDEKLKTLNNEQ